MVAAMNKMMDTGIPPACANVHTHICFYAEVCSVYITVAPFSIADALIECPFDTKQT